MQLQTPRIFCMECVASLLSIEKLLEEQSKKLDFISMKLDLVKNIVKSSDGLEISADVSLPLNPANWEQEFSILIQDHELSIK